MKFEKSSIEPSYTLVHQDYIWIPISLREIGIFLGLVVNHLSAFKFLPLHYRRIQLRYIDKVKQGKDYKDIFSFDDGSINNWSWWTFCPDSITPLSFIPFSPESTIYTDASRKGWRACLSSGFSAAGI